MIHSSASASPMSDRGSPLLDAFSLPSFLDSSEQEMPDVLVSYEHMDILSFLPGEVAIFVLELLPVEDLCRFGRYRKNI